MMEIVVIDEIELANSEVGRAAPIVLHVIAKLEDDFRIALFEFATAEGRMPVAAAEKEVVMQ